MNWRCGLALVLALCVAGCKTYSSRIVHDPQPGIARLKNGGSIRAEVDSLVEPLFAKGKADGLAIGIFTPDDGNVFFGYGKTGSTLGPAPPQADTLFEVGSVAKVFVSAVVVELVRRGELHYGDTVRDILPAEVQVSAAAGELTIYDLLTHTSGLPRQPATFSQLTHFINYLFTGENLYSYIDREFLYKYLRKCHLPPRSEREYAYSNIGLGLLAHLIEVRTGKRLEDLVLEHVTAPLGMNDTTYRLSEEQKRRLAPGHAGGQPRFVRRHTPLPPWDMGEIMNPTAGLYSSAADLVIFARANLGAPENGLRPLLCSTHQVQLRRPEEDVAFGWLLNRFESPPTTIVYKHGMVAGYHAYIGIEKERQLAVVVLCNTFGWVDEVGHNLLLRLAGIYPPVPERRPGPPAHGRTFRQEQAQSSANRAN